jgi:uridine phosphorylase
MQLQNNYIPESELIINPDGSIYHLNLLPEHICDTIITVGDPDRVREVSKYFDSLEVQIQKREFLTHIGRVANQRVMVISTGIGTDNIDICFNELDALANINFSSRRPNPQHRQLNFIRIGTSGCLDKNLPLDTLLVSRFAVGLEGLMLFYEREHSKTEQHLLSDLIQFAKEYQIILPISPTVVSADLDLLARFADLPNGITLTATGFYAPQGRQLRAKSLFKNGLDLFNRFQYQNYKISNFEMETAGIYGLANLLGHKAISLNALVANRALSTFSQNPQAAVEKLIVKVLANL